MTLPMSMKQPMATANGHAEANEEIPIVDGKTPGVENVMRTTVVDGTQGIPGVDDKTSGIDNGRDNETKPDKISIVHTAGRISLLKQPRKDCNCKD